MKMKPGEFIALSACIMMLTALGIDIMLPAFAQLREHLGLRPESTETAQIISFFFMGQVVQIIFGTLSDSFGRLAILRIGFPIYIASGIAAAFAPNLLLILVFRFVAGMGASALFMATIAGVRDRFKGDEMARKMSLVFTIFLLVPVIAPFLGVAIMSVSNWQAVFLTPPLFAVIIFAWSFRMEESLPREKRISLNWKAISQTIRSIFSNPIFIRYTGITTLLFTALSAYVSSSEHIIGNIYGKPGYFAWIFAGGGLLCSFSTLLNARLSTKYGARRTLRALLVIYTLVSTLLLFFTIGDNDPPGMIIFFTTVSLLLAINLAVEPNSSALALEPLGNMAGMAAAIYGTSFFFIGSLLGSFISQIMDKKVLPLVGGFFIIGVGSLFIAVSDRKRLRK